MGEAGYFTRCQNSDCPGGEYYKDYCEAGYTQIGLCGGRTGQASRACNTACPTGTQGGCNTTCDAQRRICRRLRSDYKTETEGNTFNTCCILTADEAKLADCPPVSIWALPYAMTMLEIKGINVVFKTLLLANRHQTC